MTPKLYFSNHKLMKLAPIISLIIPFLTIFFPISHKIAENHYKLGLPFQFINYYGEHLPNQTYSLFTWNIFKSHVLFNLPMYILNAILVYLIIILCSIIIKKRFNNV